MKNSKIVLYGLLHALGVLVYVLLVAWIMFNGQRFFGQMDGFLGPAAMLMLFVLSAAITGALVFGRPALMYLNGQKTEAVDFLLYTLAWLLAVTLAVFLSLMIFG